MVKPVLISGIQPSGKLHIGNYLGALKNFVELQNSDKYECFFFIADYHSLTADFDPERKKSEILDLAENYIAAGLDPKKSTIFVQSEVPETTELAWILNTVTPMGELERMTQFKDKSKSQNENINVGLFIYPTLMTADIILYDASFVPVGEDQRQHLELARTLARKFNDKFGKIFFEPKALLTETPRVMSLDAPGIKMSKSHPAGCLFLDDTPDIIRKKIKSAVTDSHSEVEYAPYNRPGMSNLLSIYSAIADKSIEKLVTEYRGKTYSEFKDDLGETIVQYLAPLQKRKAELKNKEIIEILNDGHKKASQIAKKKMRKIKGKLNLIL